MWIFRSLFIWRILLKILISSFVVMAGHQQAEYAEESELEGFPNVNPTIGQIWPHPQTIRSGGNIFLVDPFHFEFKLDKFTKRCDIIMSSLDRHKTRYFSQGIESNTRYSNYIMRNPQTTGTISQVELIMNNGKGCEKYPHEDMDEHYEIKIDSPDQPGKAQIIAFSVWGILRGMESFGQLIYFTTFDGANEPSYAVNSTQIMDFPRFSHRGIMLDSSRHFLSMHVLMQNFDLMEMNKFNVLHWHLTDNPSFPYESRTFPKLSQKGSFKPNTHVYSQTNITQIIEAARIRGIRVVPEFDTPGHMASWEPGQPGLLTKCENGGHVYGKPVNPILNSTYTFMTSFFNEVMDVFPDSLVHLGGDEVSTKCWENVTAIVNFMRQKNIKNGKLLEAYYLNKIFHIIESYQRAKKHYAVWQEAFQNGQGKLSKNAIVHVWKGGWENITTEATAAGHRVLLSSPWYLNYISYGIDWPKYYEIDPQEFGGTLQQKRLVIGGEACMWGEYVNSINLIPRLWPRASAVAEKLWSPSHIKNKDLAAPRLQEHECRMLQRGYRVEPSNGPGFCDIDWNNMFLD